MSTIAGLIAWALHAALILALAPLLMGYTRSLRARLQGRRGPPLLQPWRDLARLWRKENLLAENASYVSDYAPWLIFAAAAAAALLVPSFTLGMTTAAVSDLLLIAGLFALSHGATALAALDAGTWFGGIGVSRETLFQVFTEPVLILVFFNLALLAGNTSLDHIAAILHTGALGLRVSLGLSLAAALIAALTTLGRLPIGNPGTHLELAMLHESMLLEFSGRPLALIELAAQLRLITWLLLLAAIFIPFGIAPATSLLDWPLGLLATAAKLLLLATIMVFFESGMARMRLFRVPELLGIALMFALLGVLFLFVSQGYT